MSSPVLRPLITALTFAPLLAAQDPVSAPDVNGLRAWLAAPAEIPTDAGTAPLDRAAADAAAARVWEAWCAVIHDGLRGAALPAFPEATDDPATVAGELTLGALGMPFHLVRREATPAEPRGRALYLCMHGGGQNGAVDGPHAWDVNSREFDVQTRFAQRLYPADGLYFVPRMADDRLGRWWHAHNQDAFDRVIETAIATLGVDPDRVFVLGISEGGYGTDILAPFMPDRFAGADAMAAGVDPAENPPENLRHVAFRTDIGAEDTTYDRVGLARRFHARLDALHADAPNDYDHVLAEQAGRGHGIDYRPGVRWLRDKVRDPWPQTITWTSRTLAGRRRPACYWLGLDAGNATGTILLEARLDVASRTISIDAHGATSPEPTPLHSATLRVMLRDEMLDLDAPVTVRVNGVARFQGTPVRTLRNLVATTALRGDPRLVFPAVIEIRLPSDGEAPR